jgi:hypothetical protein
MMLSVPEATRIRRSREKRFRRILPHLRPHTADVIRDYVRALHSELHAAKQELRAWRAVAAATNPEEGKDQ